MSMSQEEIEALMSGADDIDIDDVEVDEPEAPQKAVESLDTVDKSESDEVSSSTGVEAQEDQENFDDILSGIDGIVYNEDEEPTEKEAEEQDIDAILATIQGVTDDEPLELEPPKAKSTSEDLETKINESQYPLPASAENKVVNQLNEVADDSEEKASQIFDVLSFILDENSEIASYNKQLSEFIQKQESLLTSLSTKFPNVDIFTENLAEAKELEGVTTKLSEKLDGENNKVFEAMELMQYHDINRQKIERVMAVIKKLSSYLNGIFEDDSGKAEVQIAKHISGDSNEIVDGDDIEALISEFSAEE